MWLGGHHFPPSIGNDVSARPSREAGAGEELRLIHKREALRWAQFKIIAGGNRRYWKAQEAHLRAEIATLTRSLQSISSGSPEESARQFDPASAQPVGGAVPLVPPTFTVPFIADDQAFEDAASEHANRVALACPGELIAPHSQTTSAPGEA